MPCVRWPPWARSSPEHRVARLEHGQVDGHVGLRAGMRLHVGELGTEQLLGPIAGQVFDHVDVLATAVVPAARIAFGILVGQDAAQPPASPRGWCNSRWRSFPARPADARLRLNRGPDFGITLRNGCHQKTFFTQQKTGNAAGSLLNHLYTIGFGGLQARRLRLCLSMLKTVNFRSPLPFAWRPCFDRRPV